MIDFELKAFSSYKNGLRSAENEANSESSMKKRQ